MDRQTVESFDLPIKEERGMTADWENQTYNNNLYYVNASGLVCRLPDDISARVDIRNEMIEEDDGRFVIKY